MSHRLCTDDSTVEINQGKETLIQNSAMGLRGKEDGTCEEASAKVFQRETEIRLDLSRIPPEKIAMRGQKTRMGTKE